MPNFPNKELRFHNLGTNKLTSTSNTYPKNKRIFMQKLQNVPQITGFCAGAREQPTLITKLSTKRSSSPPLRSIFIFRFWKNCATIAMTQRIGYKEVCIILCCLLTKIYYEYLQTHRRITNFKSTTTCPSSTHQMWSGGNCPG